MITNREEVLEKAFKVFVKMNYEKASITEIAKVVVYGSGEDAAEDYPEIWDYQGQASSTTFHTN